MFHTRPDASARRRLRPLTRIAACTAMVGGAAFLLPTAAYAEGTTCTSGGSEGASPYYMLDNEYNASLAASGSWQCVWTYSTDASSWGADWDWSDASSSSQYSVLAYPAAVLGWEWGWTYSGTGLPVQLDSGDTVSSTWDYSYTQTTSNTSDVSYDMFLTSSSDPGDQNPNGEVMVWLNEFGGAGPAGNDVGTYTVDGTTWTLYVDTDNTWPIYSFVRTTTTEASSNLSLTGFTSWLVSNEGVNSSWYLVSVQAGSEVWHGEGQINTSDYSVSIS